MTLCCRESVAERLPASDCSVSVVVCATALHWFDCGAFYSEVNRVLVPGGVVACTCYNWYTEVVGHQNSAEIVDIMNEVRLYYCSLELRNSATLWEKCR